MNYSGLVKVSHEKRRNEGVKSHMRRVVMRVGNQLLMLTNHIYPPLLHHGTLIGRVNVVHNDDRRFATRGRCSYWHRHRRLLRDTDSNALSSRRMGSWCLGLGTVETRHRK